MKKYPSVNQANALAKYISRTLKIKLSYAKEAVAYMHACSDFNELCDKSGLVVTRRRGMCLPTPSEDDLVKLKALLTPHISAIRIHINPEVHLDSSVLSKVANKNIHQLSRKIVELLIYGDEEIDWSNSDSVISYLEFYDDSPSLVLVEINNQTATNINPWIEPQALGLRIYGYYEPHDKFLNIVIREFDFDFVSPIKSKELSQRKWFASYVTGYLSYLAQQLTSLGYHGNLRLCRVNLLSGNDIITPDEQRRSKKDLRLSSAFYRLIELGGHWDWDRTSSGERLFIGVKIPLDLLALNHPSK